MQLMPRNLEMFHGSLIIGKKIYFSLAEFSEQDYTCFLRWLGFLRLVNILFIYSWDLLFSVVACQIL